VTTRGPFPWRLFAGAAVICGLAGLLSGTACGCQPAQSPQANARTIARDSVDGFEAVWKLAHDTCESVATVDASHPNQVLWAKCSKVLLPARNGMLAAAAAVDAWTDADQQNIGCLVGDLIVSFTSVEELFVELGVVVPSQFGQAVSLAASLAPMCVRLDAGSGDADADADGEGG